jgi:hypothetical protein
MEKQINLDHFIEQLKIIVEMDKKAKKQLPPK